ncbi:MAG: hypothetical protein C0395_07660 [Gemmatimonas sp.]|nr:hypothetical protein [Gemmatimonas sp.]
MPAGRPAAARGLPARPRRRDLAAGRGRGAPRRRRAPRRAGRLRSVPRRTRIGGHLLAPRAVQRALLDRAQPDTSGRPHGRHARAGRAAAAPAGTRRAGASGHRAAGADARARPSGRPLRPAVQARRRRLPAAGPRTAHPGGRADGAADREQPPVRGGAEEAEAGGAADPGALDPEPAAARTPAGGGRPGPGRLQPQQRRGQRRLLRPDRAGRRPARGHHQRRQRQGHPRQPVGLEPPGLAARPLRHQRFSGRDPRTGQPLPLREHRPDPLRHAVPGLRGPRAPSGALQLGRPQRPDPAPGRRLPAPAGEGRPPAGRFDFGGYEEETLDFNPGDMLFLYTDGLTETVDHTDEEFGTERVERLLSEHHGLGADDLLAVMNAELRAFSGRDQADDDVTLLVLKALHAAAGNPAGDAAYAQREPAPLIRAEYES